jgi:hypothetical protein
LTEDPLELARAVAGVLSRKQLQQVGLGVAAQ